VKSILRAAMTAALLAVLLGAADAHAQSPTGGFSSEPPPLPAPTANIALAPDGRTAIAPAGAPAAVVKAVTAANRLTRKPYKWGGGHGRWRDSGYDCSGTVSYVLHAAGLLDGPLASGPLMSWGEAGPGKWVTIYSNPGHVFLEVAGIRFDTSGRGVSGSRWQNELRGHGGFVARHPAGL